MKIDLKNDGKEAEIFVYGAIGDDFFGDGITAKQFADALKAAGKNAELKIRINSPGGDAFQGVAIYNLLSERKNQKKTVVIDGMAASAASVIAMAGDEISIASAGQIMIHNAMSNYFGDAKSHREVADVLQGVTSNLADIYVARTKNSRDDILSMMDEETYMDAKEAQRLGFVDRVSEAFAVAASIDFDRCKWLNREKITQRQPNSTSKASDPLHVYWDVISAVRSKLPAEPGCDGIDRKHLPLVGDRHVNDARRLIVADFRRRIDELRR